MVSAVSTTILILIFAIFLGSISVTTYYPHNEGKMATMTINGLSGSETVQLGTVVTLSFFGLVFLAMFLTNKEFREWYSKKFKRDSSK